MSNQVAKIEQHHPAAPALSTESQAVLAMIERVCLNPEADMAKLEKMLEMQERMLDRNAKQAFTAAIAAMQEDMPEVVERGKIKANLKSGGTMTTAFATFEDINAAVRPVLVKHGFAITFRVQQDAAVIRVTAVLSHREGHSEETSIEMPADTTGSKNAVQAVGSSISYGKRYTMSALLNIATRGEDDDANGAVAVKKVSAFQAATIRQLAMKAPKKTQEWLKANYGAAENVPASEYNWIEETLREAGDE